MNTKYFWVSDYEKNTGEGNLARLYLSKITGKKKIISCQKLFSIKLIHKILNYKYILYKMPAEDDELE